jgi:hypothetical protein
MIELFASVTPPVPFLFPLCDTSFFGTMLACTILACLHMHCLATIDQLSPINSTCCTMKHNHDIQFHMVLGINHNVCIPSGGLSALPTQAVSA